MRRTRRTGSRRFECKYSDFLHTPKGLDGPYTDKRLDAQNSGGVSTMWHLLRVLLVGVAGCGSSVAPLYRSGAVIKRNPQGQVIVLLLESTRLTDDELAHVSGLTNLEHLVLSPPMARETNRVTNRGLVHIKSLRHLLRLDLGGTQITDAGLVQIEGLTSLTKLDLSGIKITDAGLLHLRGLARLEHLNLRDTRITDSGIAQLRGRNLKSLILPQPATTDLGLQHYLAAVEPQTRLDLGNWRITNIGLVELKAQRQLRWLKLPEHVGDADAHELKQSLADCRIFKRKQNPILGKQNPIQQDGPVALEKLASRFTRNKRKEVVRIDLPDTQITDVELAPVKEMTKLQFLNLRNTAITDAGLAHLKESTHLRWLDVQATQITNRGLAYLGGMVDLWYLNLSHTVVSTAGVAHLRAMTTVRHLDLSQTQIGDRALADLTEWSKLRVLNCSSTALTDVALAYLKQMKSLTYLDLRNTRITVTGIDQLQQAMPGCTIQR